MAGHWETANPSTNLAFSDSKTQGHFSKETLHSVHRFLKGSVTPKTTRTPVLRPYTPPGGSEYLEEKVQISFYSGSLELSWTLVRVGS